MSDYMIPKLSEEVIEGVRSGNLPEGTGLDIFRYLKVDGEGNLLFCIVYIEEWSADGDSCNVRGAYWGYAGGGEYESGFFYIQEGESVVLDFSEAEEDENADLYNALLFECGRFYEEDDGIYRPTDYASDLLANAEEDQEEGGSIYMDEGFDGDSLEDISNNWLISLRFEG